MLYVVKFVKVLAFFLIFDKTLLFYLLTNIWGSIGQNLGTIIHLEALDDWLTCLVVGRLGQSY